MHEQYHTLGARFVAESTHVFLLSTTSAAGMSSHGFRGCAATVARGSVYGNQAEVMASSGLCNSVCGKLIASGTAPEHCVLIIVSQLCCLRFAADRFADADGGQRLWAKRETMEVLSIFRLK